MTAAGGLVLADIDTMAYLSRNPAVSLNKENDGQKKTYRK